MLTKSPSVFVPDNTNLKQRLLHSYHNSLLSSHRGRDATYSAISRDFYWRNLAKDVRRWVNRCTECIKYKTLTQKPSPMNVRMYLYPFHTLGIDFVGPLPTSSSGNKYILTAVCPFSNFLISVPVPDKTATTTARALLDHVFCKFGFSAVIQSDRGSEFLNAVLSRITKLLNLKHVFTTPYRPRLNGCTERTHRWLNSAFAIYCDKHQHEWENYLQTATYSHNISPISGCEHLDPFFLNFGRHALSLENVSIQLPPNPISQDHYAVHLISRLQDAHKEFTSIKNDLRRYQREYYDSKARIINIPEGKTVYIRKDHVSPGLSPRFTNRFDGPYKLVGYYHGRKDLLKIQDQSGNVMKRVNIEKVVTAEEPYPLHLINENFQENEAAEEPIPVQNQHKELKLIAYKFAEYLLKKLDNKAFASEACKYVYSSYPPARDVLNRYGKLKGLASQCPFLELKGATHGGTYTIHLLSEEFNKISKS